MPKPTPATHATDEAETFAAAVRRWRQHRSLTQAELAARAGTSVQNVSNWEKGKAPRRSDMVAALDEALSAKGELLRLYALTNGDLVARVAALEQRMTEMELTRDVAMPELRANADQIGELWDEIRRIARDVQRLAGPAQPWLELPPGLAP